MHVDICRVPGLIDVDLRKFTAIGSVELIILLQRPSHVLQLWLLMLCASVTTFYLCRPAEVTHLLAKLCWISSFLAIRRNILILRSSSSSSNSLQCPASSSFSAHFVDASSTSISQARRRSCMACDIKISFSSATVLFLRLDCNGQVLGSLAFLCIPTQGV